MLLRQMMAWMRLVMVMALLVMPLMTIGNSVCPLCEKRLLSASRPQGAAGARVKLEE